MRRFFHFIKWPEILTARRVCAILFVAGCLATVSWAIVTSFQEETTDWFLNIDALRTDTEAFRINIISVDEVAGRAQASTQLILNRYSFVSVPKVKGPYGGKFLLNELAVRVGPVATTDLGPEFDAMGLISLSLLPESLVQTEPGPDYHDNPPAASQEEFVVLGQPKFYPFDRYLMVGYMSAKVLASQDKKEFFGVEDAHTEVYLRASNFVMRGASNQELLNWPTSTYDVWNRNREGSELQKRALKDSGPNRRKVFVVVLQRPFFLRFFAVFLLATAVVSMAFYAVKSDVRAFGLQAVGYFVGLWAIRQMLVAGGPRVFTAVDYAVLTLYVILAAALVAKELWTEQKAKAT
jgi:hypothetical protein